HARRHPRIGEVTDDRTTEEPQSSVLSPQSSDHPQQHVSPDAASRRRVDREARRRAQVHVVGWRGALRLRRISGLLAGGDSQAEMLEIMNFTAPLLPADKPRYLMGVGTPEDLLDGVAAGIDMFDCVMPTRNARNGSLFTSRGKVAIKNARFADDPRPLDANCS